MKAHQKGFGLIELLLVLAILAGAVLIGFYVDRPTHNPTSASTPTETQVKPKLTLQTAVEQAQTVYNSLIQSSPGTPVDSSKPWDLDFINAHKNWFSQQFVAKASTASAGNNKYLLICYDPTSDGFIATGNSSNNKTAELTVREKEHGQPINIKFPVTMSASGSNWVIDSVDISHCP